MVAIPAKLEKPTEEMKALARRAGSSQIEIARAAQAELASAIEVPIKKGILRGDIIGGIFSPIDAPPGIDTDFPIDLLEPGTEHEFVAYTIPNAGRIPEKAVEGDYVRVPVYETGCSLDTLLKYIRDARWDVVARMKQVMEGMMTRKMNDDGVRTLLAAGVARNVVPYDDMATAGLFTKRLVALGQTYMRRYGGGNSASNQRSQLTDMYVSPEARQDVLSWDLTQVSDAIRTQIWTSWENGGITKIGPVSLHDWDELGVDQDYQNYYSDVLGGTLPGSKTEMAIGLDLSNRDSFVMPVRSEVEVHEDMTFHRQRRWGMYSWQESGFGVLDSRRVLMVAL